MRLWGEELVCERGGRTVFRGLSFAVAAGGLLILRGPNGAGKTSLLRMIAGFIEPAAGRLGLDGGEDDHAIAQHCHLIAHQEAVKPALTLTENLAFWRDFLGGGDVEAALAAVNLSPLAGYQAQLLSAGQKRRLALARLALARRPVWLLDEPTVGLDAASQELVRDLMRRHLAGGGLIVASTHVELGMAGETVFDFAGLGRAA